MLSSSTIIKVLRIKNQFDFSNTTNANDMAQFLSTEHLHKNLLNTTEV